MDTSNLEMKSVLVTFSGVFFSIIPFLA